ncbi:MAG: flagellar motor protein MotB [Candidatus Gastranaerophilales bacterium]|nr:flagellar motor protein MotB [Candidatus Gastranaerophilales bacterium]
MGRKKPPEEHENLERWLVSYGDFITLLFATFVVLYALSQTDAGQFEKLGASLEGAFNPSIIEGSSGMMDGQGESPIDSKSADSIMESLLLEYISPKYEQTSFEKIEEEIQKLINKKELSGVEAKIDDRGLIITLSEKALLFQPGSATINPEAKVKLDKIGAIIGQKFILHLIRVEGHTDSDPLTSDDKYPSNWELSAARASSIIRYLILRFNYKPELFTAVGFADTRPKVPNTSAANKVKNRRVDIVVLRNKFKTVENSQDSIIKMDKSSQRKMKEQQLKTVNSVLGLSDAAKQLTSDEADDKNVIILDTEKQ